MKQQIARFSPHQNGKVFGVLVGVSAFVILVPMLVVISLTLPAVDQNGNPIDFPVLLFAFSPIVYFVFGYLGVALGCVVYNFLFKYIGGFEFEAKVE
jgi:hypothetical protein